MATQAPRMKTGEVLQPALPELLCLSEHTTFLVWNQVPVYFIDDYFVVVLLCTHVAGMLASLQLIV